MKSFKSIDELAKYANGQIRLKDLYTVGIYSNGRYVKVNLPESEKYKLAVMIAEYLYATKSRQENIINALLTGEGDYSYLECFYLDYVQQSKSAHISNSLSGEAFEYCRRRFYKSI